MPCQLCVAAWTVATNPLVRCEHDFSQSFLGGGKGLPSENADGGPPVRRHDLPHDGLELEDDVRNVEDGQQPVVAIAVELEVLFHACDLGISRFHTRSAYGHAAHVARDVYTRCWSGPGRRGDLIIPVSLTVTTL